MSKIRSRLDLQIAMESEFAWRKKELLVIKTTAYLNRNSIDRDVYVRSAIALLYAHWEGFIKAIGTSYLEYVSRRRMRNEQLAPNFLAMVAGGILHRAAVSSKHRLRVAVVEFFRSQMHSRSKLNWRNAINTKSNLSSTVFADIVDALGLDYTPFATKEKLIDEKLLATRNSIAHGRHMIFDLDEYIKLHEDVFSMMQEFYAQVESAADHGRFLAATV